MSSLQSTKTISVPTVGQTVTIANQDGDIRLILNPAGTLATLTVTMPSAPRDGQVVTICSSNIVTLLTMNGGTILWALTTFAAVNTFASWLYDSSGVKWYRIS